MPDQNVRFPNGSLNSELCAFQTFCEQEWPPDALQLIQDAVDQLNQDGIEQSVLTAGDHAPNFTLPDQAGNLVRSWELLAQGPLVLHFYRGMW